MKKFAVLFGLAAMVAAGALTVSCRNSADSDDSYNPSDSKSETPEYTYDWSEHYIDGESAGFHTFEGGDVCTVCGAERLFLRETATKLDGVPFENSGLTLQKTGAHSWKATGTAPTMTAEQAAKFSSESEGAGFAVVQVRNMEGTGDKIEFESGWLKSDGSLMSKVTSKNSNKVLGLAGVCNVNNEGPSTTWACQIGEVTYTIDFSEVWTKPIDSRISALAELKQGDYPSDDVDEAVLGCNLTFEWVEGNTYKVKGAPAKVGEGNEYIAGYFNGGGSLNLTDYILLAIDAGEGAYYRNPIDASGNWIGDFAGELKNEAKTSTGNGWIIIGVNDGAWAPINEGKGVCETHKYQIQFGEDEPIILDLSDIWVADAE